MNELHEIHIGHLIECKIKERQMSYAEVARQLYVDRTTIYSIIQSKSIDIERLIALGKILEYDFIREVYLPLLPHVDIKMNLSVEELNELINANPEKFEIIIKRNS